MADARAPIRRRRLTKRRLVGLDRSGPEPGETRRGQPLRPLTIPNLIGYARLAGALGPTLVQRLASAAPGALLEVIVTYHGDGPVSAAQLDAPTRILQATARQHPIDGRRGKLAGWFGEEGT